MTLSLNPSRAAEISSIRRFSDVLEPFEITSKRDFESVKSWSGIVIRRRDSSSDVSAAAASNISLKAITSPAIAERTIRLALYDLKYIGTA